MKRSETDELVSVCCQCGRVRLGNGWHHQNRIPTDGVEYTHGYCPLCLSLALASVTSSVGMISVGSSAV